MIARHLMFILPAAFAFAGLWLTAAKQKAGRISAGLLSADLSASVLPGESLPALQTCHRAGDDPAGGVFVLGSKPGANPLAVSHKPS